jgi:hypothetical protein
MSKDNFGECFYQFKRPRKFAGAGYDKGGFWIVGSNCAVRADVRDAVDTGFDLDLICCEESMSARNILMDDPEASCWCWGLTKAATLVARTAMRQTANSLEDMTRWYSFMRVDSRLTWQWHPLYFESSHNHNLLTQPMTVGANVIMIAKNGDMENGWLSTRTRHNH